MLRSIALISAGLGLAIAAAGSASAQVALPSGTSVPGTGDATKMSAGNREASEDYNRLVGSGAKATTGEDIHIKHTVAVPATAADIKPGSPLRDIKGVPIGTVAELDADGVVVATGTAKIKVPLMGFGKDDRGLLLNLTAARFNELVAKAQASH